ncbi:MULTISPECIES: hypothetical protein [Rhizobium/Agrobacterium group]|uniref:hypothetical protein n=1 Tax=Rhizobium/Agrobacterium group TaxID=227290 RepID=UPI001ADCC7DE|nr:MULTISPECIES: hypothetical protein [Rhizobium/Agrobacterium group]MBO9112465.1 hypothetical protein [Agrobacterium sp. S2/73]QXZ75974.1 hypothetical protein J5276_28200 [Agrobacterium sp. S7/73]QYA17015.1 hypothetical protein J5284_33305 [Rhizobium sp. AB2/73]UEQ85412.1 hypothetical protein I8E17_33630 [Rhizobium sp. AB2/73]
MTVENTMAKRRHIALHLAHRWFAFLEAPGGNLETHLTIFHPQVRLSGRRGSHQFANDHASLVAWFAAVPDEISSHHILHSSYATAENGDGLLSMVVAYQAKGDEDVHGSIISYETRIEFVPGGARFTALDKTPILPNTRTEYETSWASNRVAALVHAELGSVPTSENCFRAQFGNDVRQLTVSTVAPEGSRQYDAVITYSKEGAATVNVLHVNVRDDVGSELPDIEKWTVLNS